MFKIVQLTQDAHAEVHDTPESDEYFCMRIESVAEVYAKDGWEIISLVFPSETRAVLFMRSKVPFAAEMLKATQ